MGTSTFWQEQTLQLAANYHHLGQWQQATDLYQQVLAADAGAVGALEGLAHLAQDRGELNLAQHLLEQAIAQHPQSLNLQLHLAELYRQQQQWSAAIRCYETAWTLAPLSPPERTRLHTHWAQALQTCGALEEAANHLQQALQDDPTAAHLHAGLGYLYSGQERWTDAVACYQRALQFNPRLPDVHNALGHALLIQADVIEARRAYEQALQLDPSNQAALAHLIIACREAGAETTVSSWLNYEQLVQAYPCEALPLGYTSIAELNTMLAQRLLQHPSLTWNPESLSTWGGMQSGDLLADPTLSQPLRTLIRPYVWHYLQSLPADPEHPLQWNRPQELRLGWLWGVSLQPQGYQRLHIHDPAWLSGVYYVQVPSMTGAEGAGCLEFSQTPAEYPTSTPTPSKRIYPENGLLVLFPGYFYHRTIPFLAGDSRISFSFNIAGQWGCPAGALSL